MFFYKVRQSLTYGDPQVIPVGAHHRMRLKVRKQSADFPHLWVPGIELRTTICEKIPLPIVTASHQSLLFNCTVFVCVLATLCTSYLLKIISRLLVTPSANAVQIVLTCTTWYIDKGKLCEHLRGQQRLTFFHSSYTWTAESGGYRTHRFRASWILPSLYHM